MKKTFGSSVVLAGLILVAGCALEEVTPEQRALEIIVVGDGSGPDACSVNYDEVGAAAHLINVIALDGAAHVRILDHAGSVVFEADSVSGEGSEGEMSGSQSNMVSLEPGDYQVECAMGPNVSTASLHVIPSSR